MDNTYIVNADDSEEIRILIKLLLESEMESYVIEQFEDGVGLSQRLLRKSEPMDIAILDIHMPQFNIIEAVAMLWEEWKQTYVIVISGDDDIDTILKLQNEYHIWGYVLKGKSNFGECLSKLVKDAHTKVQHKNNYIKRLLKAQEQLPIPNGEERIRMDGNI